MAFMLTTTFASFLLFFERNVIVVYFCLFGYKNLQRDDVSRETSV